MILADTSVWIQHFRNGDSELARVLSDGRVYMHPHVLGELACGNLKDRAVVLANLQSLPRAAVASEAEVFQFVEERRLWGRGFGWTDMHLIASALLSHCGLWTLDKRLGIAAAEAGI
jgi:hypothetical protein